MEKILYFHPINDFSGSSTALTNLLEKKYRESETIDIVTDGKNGALSLLPNACLIQIKYPLYKGKRIWGISFLCKQLSVLYSAFKMRNKYDSYYLNTITMYSAAIGARLFKKKIYWHIHEIFSYSSTFYADIERKFMVYIYDRTECTRIYVSKYVQSKYKKNDKCSEIIIPNILSQKYVSNVNPVPLRQRGKNTILMLSSLTKAKGIFTFFEVAKKLKEYTFLLVISSSEDKIRSFILVDIPENVTIYPRQKDIHPFMRKSDLLLNLSNPFFLVETFGMTIIESMIYGIPSIVPNVGGPTEIVKNGYNGYCVDVTDVDQVINYIKKVFDEREYNKLVSNCLIECKKYC